MVAQVGKVAFREIGHADRECLIADERKENAWLLVGVIPTVAALQAEGGISHPRIQRAGDPSVG